MSEDRRPVDEKLAVMGAGLMGHSIALNAAWRGIRVTLQGTGEDDLQRAKKAIELELRNFEHEQLIEADEGEDIMGRLRFVVDVEEALHQCTFVIEAIPEQLQLKQDFYRKLDSLSSPETILASNTSALNPPEIAAYMNHPERMLVTHFWNPAHLIPLVEIVLGERTAETAVERATNLMLRMRKKPIRLAKTIPGFIGNRLQYAMLREAEYLLEQGVASREDIDAAVTYSLGRRYAVTGPLISADLGGLDVFHAVSAYLYPDLASHTAPLPTMQELVKRGHYGAKSGKGFCDWEAAAATEIPQNRKSFLIQCLKRDEEESSQRQEM
ncbi:3-hydroxyacyl-CoA dehydrogenase family protein [Paenibacillus sp. CC-CFT747]|nr:3-hydroxyacyl-CoA dehydrogenase family protein [Paenibacillus sp. CC-CFT747]